MGGGGRGRPRPLEGGRQGLQVSWLLVSGSTRRRALPRRAAEQQVLGVAGDGVVVVQVGGVVVGAGAGDLAVQAPPHARQELMGEFHLKEIHVNIFRRHRILYRMFC